MNGSQVVSGADVVVLAVKPDVIPAVLEEIERYLTADSLVVSIAAGVPLAVLEEVSLERVQHVQRVQGLIADPSHPPRSPSVQRGKKSRRNFPIGHCLVGLRGYVAR